LKEFAILGELFSMISITRGITCITYFFSHYLGEGVILHR